MANAQQSQLQKVSGPSRVVIAFALLIVIGTALLSLPAAANGGRLSPIDALFTATSGVCITGLSTIDVGGRLSTTGQGILLVLIQLGGLGITTLSTLLLAAAGRATLGHAMSAGDSLAAVRVKPLRLLWWVALVTLAVEAIGAVILAGRFSGPDAWWQAIFHSVSAFCNAGFSLFPDSLTQYRDDHIVLAVIGLLIAQGGLGVIVLYQASHWLLALVRGRRFPLFLHSRVVLLANFALWTLGAVLLFLMERGNALGGHSLADAIAGSIFQSVSARTAGFNTIDFAAFREPTLFVLMFFMLIGASPGGCGGGLKVTTVAVLLATIFARLRSREGVVLLRRTIPPQTVQRSFLLLSLALMFLTTVVLTLLFTEESLAGPQRDDRMIVLAFEAVSAFGTVGFSAGVTGGLSNAGKLIIICCMFVGRLGPLVVALAILRPKPRPVYAYPVEELAIG